MERTLRTAVALIAALCLLPAAAGCSLDRYHTVLPSAGEPSGPSSVVETGGPGRTGASTSASLTTSASGDGSSATVDGAAAPTGTAGGGTAATGTGGLNPAGTTSLTGPGTPFPSATTTASTAPAEDFDQAVLALLSAGLDAGNREIDLASALAGRAIPESGAADAVGRVQSLYQGLLDDRPDCYYLDGSNVVRYELLSGSSGSGSSGSRLSGMTLEAGTRDAYDGSSDAELHAARLGLVAAADTVAAAAAGLPAWQQLQIVHDELVRRVEYDGTLSQADNHAAGALITGRTLCQGYAQAFQLVVQRLGIPVSLITGTARGVPHAWNLVRLDGISYHVDVTFDDPVAGYDISPAVFHSHFLRSDAVMRETHDWTAADYPACPSDGAHVYWQNGWVAGSPEDLRSCAAAYFLTTDWYDGQADTLELLYTGGTPLSDADLGALFNSALADAGIDRAYRYGAEIEKNAALLILFQP